MELDQPIKLHFLECSLQSLLQSGVYLLLPWGRILYKKRSEWFTLSSARGESKKADIYLVFSSSII